MGVDGLEGLGGPPGIPNVKPAVMSRGQDIWVLTVVFDLSGTGKPVAKSEHRLPRSPKIPAVHIAIHCASCKRIWMVGGEIDVGDGPAMGLEGMLDCT
jgi:hypothetical protein